MSSRVLIVDDSKLARMTVAKVLSRLCPEWERIEAAGADEAASLFTTSTFDLVIVDFNMPGRDGMAVVAEVKALSPSTEVIVLSANSQIDVIIQAHALGAMFLAKPLAEEDLASLLALMMGRRDVAHI